MLPLTESTTARMVARVPLEPIVPVKLRAADFTKEPLDAMVPAYERASVRTRLYAPDEATTPLNVVLADLTRAPADAMLPETASTMTRRFESAPLEVIVPVKLRAADFTNEPADVHVATKFTFACRTRVPADAMLPEMESTATRIVDSEPMEAMTPANDVDTSFAREPTEAMLPLRALLTSHEPIAPAEAHEPLRALFA